MAEYPKQISSTTMGPEALRQTLVEAVAAHHGLLSQVQSGEATFSVTFEGQGADMGATVVIYLNVSPSDDD